MTNLTSFGLFDVQLNDLFYSLTFFANSEGDRLNCFWNLLAKYDGDENPTRYATSLILYFPSDNNSAARFNLTSLIYSFILRFVFALTFLNKVDLLIPNAEPRSSTPSSLSDIRDIISELRFSIKTSSRLLTFSTVKFDKGDDEYCL